MFSPTTLQKVFTLQKGMTQDLAFLPVWSALPHSVHSKHLPQPQCFLLREASLLTCLKIISPACILSCIPCFSTPTFMPTNNLHVLPCLTSYLALQGTGTVLLGTMSPTFSSATDHSGQYFFEKRDKSIDFFLAFSLLQNLSKFHPIPKLLNLWQILFAVCLLLRKQTFIL